MSARPRRARRWTAGQLLRRGARTGAASMALVGILSLLTVSVAAVVPRLVDRQTDAELGYQLAEIGPEARSLQGNATYPILWNSNRPPDLLGIYGRFDTTFETARQTYPQPLQDAVAPPRWIVQTPGLRPSAVNGGTTSIGLQLVGDEHYLDELDVVDGTAPATWSPDAPGSSSPTSDPVDILLSTTAAAALGLRTGDVVTFDAPEPIPLPPSAVAPEPAVAPLDYRVSGLYEPKHPGAQYWAQFPSVLRATQIRTYTAPPYMQGSAYVDPLTVGQLADVFETASISLYYAVDAAALEGTDPDLMRAQLARAVATSVPLPDSAGQIKLGTSSDDALDQAQTRSRALAGLLALLVSAPLGVLVAVLLLAVQSALAARRSELALASARGASDGQLRLVMTLAGGLVSVPPAIVLIWLAAVLMPVEPDPSLIALPLLAALVAPGLFATLATAGSERGPRGRRIRGVVELSVIVLTALAILALVRRGFAEASAAAGIDPLLSIAPLLVAVSVGIVVLRLYPLPMRAVTGVARRGRALTGFVGSIRFMRTPTLGLAGVLALVVGLSVALFSAALLTTFDRGILQASATFVGADARIDAPLLTEAQQEAVEQVDGVLSVAGVQLLGSFTLDTGGPRPPSITLVLADTEDLGTMTTLPRGLQTDIDGRTPVVVSNDLLAALGGQTTTLVSGHPVQVLGTLPGNSGFGPTGSWVLVDSSFTERFTPVFAPERLLIRADPSLLPSMKASLEDAVGAGSPDGAAAGAPSDEETVLTVPIEDAERQTEPAVLGVRVGLIVGALLSTLLCAIAFVLGTVSAARERARITGILRTLGMPRRRTRALIAWELIPAALVAILAGGALGLALPFVVAALVDLRPFTGQADRPTIVLDPLIVGGVLIGFAFVVLVSGLIAISLGNRLSPSRTLKMGAS